MMPSPSVLDCQAETGQYELCMKKPPATYNLAGGDFLVRSFSVTVCGKPVGKVIVQRQGLYYLFSCRCNLSEDVMYRLMVDCGPVRENLGILIPQNGSFVLDTKVPAKRIGEGNMIFSLISKQEEYKGVFVPIYPEEPFTYISRLKESFLVYRNGQPGINIENQE